MSHTKGVEGAMTALTERLANGEVLKQPTWSVGPFQTATGARTFAICDLRGDILFEDRNPRPVAVRAFMKAGDDRHARLRAS